MLHNLTIGQSTSGKTTLNKALARGLRRRGIRIGVLDCLRDPEWPADHLDTDPDKFLAFVLQRGTRRERWALFIDEAGLSLGRDPRFAALTTTARHFGCVTYLIAHRWRTLPPAVRDSVGPLWVFNNSDGRELADHYDLPALRDCSRLPRGRFWLIRPMEAPARGRVDWSTRPPRIHFDQGGDDDGPPAREKSRATKARPRATR